MNIKKLLPLLLIIALLCAATSGCLGAKTAVVEKAEGQITVFADEAMKDALVAAAAAYTKPVKEIPVRETVVILFDFAPSSDLEMKIAAEEYCDIFFSLGSESMDMLDITKTDVNAEGLDFVINRTRIELSGGEGVAYVAAILNVSDRQTIAQGFLDYLVSDEGKAVLAEYGIQ